MKKMSLREQMIRDREDVVEECRVFLDKDEVKHGPCEYIDGNKCSAYMIPKVQWRFQRCQLSTHCVDETNGAMGKVRVGQQKQARH